MAAPSAAAPASSSMRGPKQDRRGRRVEGVEPQGDAELATPMLHVLPGEQSRQDSEVLAHVPQRSAVVEPEPASDDRLVANPDTEHEPALRGGLDRECLLRQGRGVTRMGRDDPGAQLDASGDPTRESERRERVVLDDLPEPCRVEPGSPDLFETLEKCVERCARARRDVGADAHAAQYGTRETIHIRGG